jgi:hypothetical protein
LTIITAQHTVGEGEIAGVEDRDRTDRLGDAAEIRLGQRGALGIGAFDGRVEPRPFLDHRSEKAQLIAGASAFAGHACRRQAALGRAAGEQRVAEVHDAIGDQAQQLRLPTRGQLARASEGGGGRAHGAFDLVGT